MQKFPPGRALGAFCLLLLALSPWGGALAEDAANQSQPLRTEKSGTVSSTVRAARPLTTAQ
jgi:hypothetical protein